MSTVSSRSSTPQSSAGTISGIYDRDRSISTARSGQSSTSTVWSDIADVFLWPLKKLRQAVSGGRRKGSVGGSKLYGDKYLEDVARGNKLLDGQMHDLQNELARRAEEAKYYKAKTGELRTNAGMTRREIDDLSNAEERKFGDA